MSKVAGKLHGATTCVLDSALVVPGLHDSMPSVLPADGALGYAMS